MKPYLHAAVGILLLFTMAAAGPAEPLMVEVRAERLIEIVNARGEREPALAPATEVKHGEEVIYTVRFTNAGREPLERASVTAAIPVGMRYVAGSAAGPGTDVSFSIDGGTVFAPAEALNFAGRDGRQRPVAPGFYTDIRWAMRYPLDPGASGYARFRAIAAEPLAPSATNLATDRR